MFTIKTILHPTDFSERSACGLPLACALARDHGARLVVAHVVEPPMPINYEGVVIPTQDTDVETVRAKLQELTDRDPKVRAEGIVVEGNPAVEILRLAEKLKCDLIVLGTHGRTGLSRLLMGSVAEQVVRKARCPVLTVKTPIPDAPASGRTAPQSAGRPVATAK